MRHGLRYTRYLGPAKHRLKHLWTAAAVNLKRLFRLTDASNDVILAGPRLDFGAGGLEGAMFAPRRPRNRVIQVGPAPDGRESRLGVCAGGRW